MATIQFSNGTKVQFNGNPTQADIEEIASQMGLSQTPTTTPQDNRYNATFRATGQETGVQAGLKAAGNLPTSAFTFGKNIYEAVSNPVQTAKGVLGAVRDIGQIPLRAVDKAIGRDVPRETPTLSAIGNVYKERYGSLDAARKTAIEDPFGVGADVLGVLQGGAALTNRTAQLNNALSTTARIATAPVTKPVSGLVRAGTEATKFAASQATGLSPETMGTIINQRGAFSAAQADELSRVDLAQDVFTAIQKASDDLGDLGSGYDSIRKSGQIVILPDDWLSGALNKFGIKLENGTVVADRTSRTRNTADLNKIQAFADNWGDAKNFTAEEYLNMRSDLAEIARYDQAGTNVSRQFAETLREGTLNSDDVRTQLPGLKELDAQYSTDIKFFNKIKKDLLNADGTFKDGAASKIVNAVNASNPERLARLEKVYPGFTKQAQVVKALEDVENAMGLKIGTYARAGAAAGGLVTGNVPLIIGAIISIPEIAVPLLKGLGYTKETVGPVLGAVGTFAKDINNFRVPGALQEYIEKNYKDGVPVGMSIKPTVTPEKVAANIDEIDAKILRNYLDNPDDPTAFIEAQDLFEKIGIDKADNATQQRFVREVFDEAERAGKSFNQGATPQTTALLEEAKIELQLNSLDPKSFNTVDEFVSAYNKKPVFKSNIDLQKLNDTETKTVGNVLRGELKNKYKNVADVRIETVTPGSFYDADLAKNVKGQIVLLDNDELVILMRSDIPVSKMREILLEEIDHAATYKRNPEFITRDAVVANKGTTQEYSKLPSEKAARSNVEKRLLESRYTQKELEDIWKQANQ